MGDERRTRRQWLAACAGTTVGMAALAGCTSGSDGNGTAAEDDPGAIADEGDYGAWPMARYNSRNRLSVPHDGLDGEPEILWSIEFDEPGAITPPVVYDDVAYVSQSNGTYTAIDLEDSAIVWEHDTDGWVTPAVSDTAVFVDGDGVEALEHDDGDVLWTSGHDESVNSIRIYDDIVYAGLESSVIALDDDGDELLSFETVSSVQSLAVDDNHVYVRSRPDEDEDNFVIAGFDRESGDEQWEHEITHAEQWTDDRFTKTVPVIDGTVYTVTDNAIISIDGVEGDLEEIIDLEQSAWTGPTVYDGTVYLERGERAIDLESGETPDQWDPDVSSETPPVVADGVGYTIGSAGQLDPHTLIAMDPETGKKHWEIVAEERTRYYFPIVLNGLVLIMEDSSRESHKLAAYG